MNTFQDLLNTVRGVGLAVEFPGDDVLEQFSAGDSVSVLRFQFYFAGARREERYIAKERGIFNLGRKKGRTREAPSQM